MDFLLACANKLEQEIKTRPRIIVIFLIVVFFDLIMQKENSIVLKSTFFNVLKHELKKNIMNNKKIQAYLFLRITKFFD
jgi:hypothetical protein